jgi:general secretion pathway protein M
MNKPSLSLYRARFQPFWQGLARREQRLLAGTALVFGGWLVWLLLIQPPLKKIDYWQTETPKLRTQAQTLDVLLRDVTTPASGADLQQALRQNLDASGLAGRYQLQATDAANPQGWLLTFDAAPADAVLGWLLGRARQFSLEVVEARLQRSKTAPDQPTTGAGSLSGTVRMNQAQGAKEAS